MKEGLYVQYGCGWDAPDGWLNFDASPTLRIERIPGIGKSISAVIKRNAVRFPRDVRYGDIAKGLPVPDGIFKGVYCSHVLEHLALDDFRIALVNTKKLLSPGGIFRMVVPDLQFYINEYQNTHSSDAALEFMCATGLGDRSRIHGVKGIASEVFGNSRHRWMWDYPSLERELQRAGFDCIRQAYFGDSSDPKFNEVEREQRWENCLGIECRRA